MGQDDVGGVDTQMPQFHDGSCAMRPPHTRSNKQYLAYGNLLWRNATMNEDWDFLENDPIPFQKMWMGS